MNFTFQNYKCNWQEMQETRKIARFLAVSLLLLLFVCQENSTEKFLLYIPIKLNLDALYWNTSRRHHNRLHLSRTWMIFTSLRCFFFISEVLVLDINHIIHLHTASIFLIFTFTDLFPKRIKIVAVFVCNPFRFFNIIWLL